jgi:crotonobetainyl-CoA:carnitine CoA-transferase CaiB-like acyl-CoA transferase
MASTGPAAGEPFKVGVAIADVVTGLYTAVAALSALHARRDSGHGYAIDVALLDCAVASMVNVAQAYVTSGSAPKRQGNAHLQIVPYELFKAADGWLVLAVGNDGQWRSFCSAAGREELGRDASFARNADRVRRREELVPLVAAIIQEKTVAAWQERLDAAGVPCGPVWTLPQLFASDLARERGLKISARKPDGTTVELLRSPLTALTDAKAPPALGEHNNEVLRDILGLDAAAIGRAREGGAW